MYVFPRFVTIMEIAHVMLDIQVLTVKFHTVDQMVICCTLLMSIGKVYLIKRACRLCSTHVK